MMKFKKTMTILLIVLVVASLTVATVSAKQGAHISGNGNSGIAPGNGNDPGSFIPRYHSHEADNPAGQDPGTGNVPESHWKKIDIFL